jgi:phosphocarrier protein HPr
MGFVMDRNMNKKEAVLSKRARVSNPLGIHSRPAAKIVEISSHAVGNIWLSRKGHCADAKSILDILTLACSRGTEVTLSMENMEDEAILSEIAQTIEQGFGE